MANPWLIAEITDNKVDRRSLSILAQSVFVFIPLVDCTATDARLKTGSQHMNGTDLNKSTQLQDAFIVHTRVVEIGWRETRTAGAQSVRAL